MQFWSKYNYLYLPTFICLNEEALTSFHLRSGSKLLDSSVQVLYEAMMLWLGYH